MKINLKQKYLLMAVGYSAWSGLGFIRGLQSYTYNHNKREKNEPIIYLNSICYGFFGICIYCNPIFFPVNLYKEMYRLEVNIRKLENEKTTDFYNHVF